MKELVVLGFSLGFNSSAALVSTKVGTLAAISQERMNNQKNTKELPIDAMIECCKISGVKEIDEIVFSHYQVLTWKELLKYAPEKYKEAFYDCETKATVDGYYPYVQQEAGVKSLFKEVLENIFRENGIELKAETLKRVEHHKAHRYSAYAVYGETKEKHICVTSDGFGDGISERIVEVSDEGDKILFEKPLVNSIALVYQFVTGALGFKMHQHEGKITGLASYGKPIYLDDIKQLLYMENESGINVGAVDTNKLLPLSKEEENQVKESTIIDFDDFLRLKKTVFDFIETLSNNGAKMEDIAATVQQLAEEVILDDIEVVCGKRYTDCKCYLAGGLFANVKLNQRIKERNAFSEVLVSPPMGDEGTALGSAYAIIEEAGYDDSIMLYDSAASKNYYNKLVTGTFMDADEIKKIPFDVNVYMLKQDEIANFIAEKLAKKRIVCLCTGKMEFGPRALCDRSILYECTKKETNSWLNKQLGRTEFMPFAPVTNEENAERFFIGIENAMTTAKFMTMTFDCTEEFRDTYKAAAHVDGTARPQLISKHEHPLMHSILEKYEEKTGLSVLINTSFNLHNYPIIEDAQNALDSWYKSNTDVLVIGNIAYVRNKGENKHENSGKNYC